MPRTRFELVTQGFQSSALSIIHSPFSADSNRASVNTFLIGMVLARVKIYKVLLGDTTKIAINRLTDYKNQGRDVSFQCEVEMTSVAVHRYLLGLIGFCTTSIEALGPWCRHLCRTSVWPG